MSPYSSMMGSHVNVMFPLNMVLSVLIVQGYFLPPLMLLNMNRQPFMTVVPLMLTLVQVLSYSTTGDQSVLKTSCGTLHSQNLLRLS